MKKGPPERDRAPAKAQKQKKLVSVLPPAPTAVEVRGRYSEITEKEMTVLLLYLELGNDKEVAKQLHTSPHTVRNQLASIEAKIGVAGRAELLIHFWRIRAEPYRPA